MNVLKADAQVRIIAALTEGCSIRSTERLTGAHRDSIMRLGLRVGAGCERLHDSMFRNLNVSILELDEVWSFIQKKQKRVQSTDPGYMGDCYTWTGLDAVSKAFVSYRVGKRTSQDCMEFVWDLRTRILNQCQITSDGYAPYAPAIRAAFGWNVDYAQLRKIFEGDSEARDAAHRYSPGRVTGVEKDVIFGAPKEENISTSYVERSNLTVRMSMRRFTRLTNGFSRKPENHAAAFALFVGHYNLCRVHETIRMTPAMALGVTDHVWTIGELVDAALAAKPADPITPQPIIPRPSRLVTKPAPKGTGKVQLRVVRGGKG